jgi:iron-sulfur cluster assembly protein
MRQATFNVEQKRYAGMAIEITDRAVSKIREVATQEAVDFSSAMLRVAVIPGGCSGLTYDLGWDTTEQDGDEIAELDGIRVVMDRRSRLYVDGSKLDFTDGLEGRGFHFTNPQASRTCACGESFGL